MIKFENTEVVGWEAAIRGMRNPMNSWEKGDSDWCSRSCSEKCTDDAECLDGYIIGHNDLDLMKKLRNAGTDHRKFMRMIVVYADITAPLYWWKEFDTYKVGTVANSCSTMHKIQAKKFALGDFSYEHLDDGEDCCDVESCDPYDGVAFTSRDVFGITIRALNYWRERYLVALKTETETGLSAKDIWWQMIQLLPSSYNQKRTVMLNYEVLANIYKSRKNHKLDEWSDQNDFGFCTWIHSLPYSELITGNFAK